MLQCLRSFRWVQRHGSWHLERRLLSDATWKEFQFQTFRGMPTKCLFLIDRTTTPFCVSSGRFRVWFLCVPECTGKCVDTVKGSLVIVWCHWCRTNGLTCIDASIHGENTVACLLLVIIHRVIYATETQLVLCYKRFSGSEIDVKPFQMMVWLFRYEKQTTPTIPEPSNVAPTISSDHQKTWQLSSSKKRMRCERLTVSIRYQHMCCLFSQLHVYYCLPNPIPKRAHLNLTLSLMKGAHFNLTLSLQKGAHFNLILSLKRMLTLT